MKIRMQSRHLFTVTAVSGVLLLSLGVGLGQQSKKASEAQRQPHLFHIFTDAQGQSHIQEIKLVSNRRAEIPGAKMVFNGLPAPPQAVEWHHTPARQFAITVVGSLNVEAGDGTKAHLETGDMAFLEDLAGKGHRTFEEGASSVFIRVPDGFDVKAWAAGTK